MKTRQVSASRGVRSPEIAGFYEPDTGSIQYLVSDPATGKAAIVDAVLNFDPNAARTDTRAADEILGYVRERGLTVEWILDTHPHADHLMAAAYLKEKLRAKQAIGEKVREIAAIWRELYHLPHAFDLDKAFDRLFADADTFNLGSLPVRVMLSPGHTAASISFLVGDDAALVHDTLMQPDTGSSRADFPGADPRALYRSIRALLRLPEATRLFVGHDYCKDGRDPQWEATVAEHRAHNVHVKDGTSEEEFVRLRSKRDRTLPLPARMLHALQVNLNGGRLPPQEADGHAYLRIPLNRF